MRAVPFDPPPPWPTVPCSHTTTAWPRWARAAAALSPRAPAPTTANPVPPPATSGPAVVVQQGRDTGHVRSADGQHAVAAQRREPLVVPGQGQVLAPAGLVQ